MQTLVHRALRALSGAGAIYLAWRMVAPPFDARGPAPLTRVLLAFLAAALVLLVVVPLRRMSARVEDEEGRTPALPARARPRWRSRAARRLASRTDRRASLRRSASPGGDVDHTPAHPERVVVLCDGTGDGDAACQLAESLAERHHASVQALALFPMTALKHATSGPDTPGPIECFLNDVNSQLVRTTPSPWTWRLTLVVHDLVGELRRTCTEFAPDTIILPATMCATGSGVMHAVSTAVSGAGSTACATAPILCVVGGNATPVTRLMRASPRADTRTLAMRGALPAADGAVRRPT